MPAPDKFGVALRIGIFAFLGILIYSVIAPFLAWAGTLIQAAVGLLAAATITTAFTQQVFERRPIFDIGLYWTPASRRNLLIGVGTGIATALLVSLLPVALGLAKLQWTAAPAPFRSLIFISLILFFGALGEEILFRGYGFQVMARSLGPFATILPVGFLFAWGHSGNLGVNHLGLVNTFLWGAMLGWCVFRSGDLWLATGLHFGWNWALPLLGGELSGFKMGVTGLTTVWNAGPLWSGGDYGLEGSLLTTFVLPLVAWVLFRAPIHTQRLRLIQLDEEMEPREDPASSSSRPSLSPPR